MSMTGSFPKVDILTGPQRRRRWSVSEKLEIVAKTRGPGVTVSLVALGAAFRRTTFFPCGGCGRCRRPGTVRDEGRVRDDRRRPLECRRTGGRALAKAARPPAAAGWGIAGADRARHRRYAVLRLRARLGCSAPRRYRRRPCPRRSRADRQRFLLRRWRNTQVHTRHRLGATPVESPQSNGMARLSCVR